MDYWALVVVQLLLKQEICGSFPVIGNYIYYQLY